MAQKPCGNRGATGLEDCPNPKCKDGKVEVIAALDLGFPHQWEGCKICKGEGKIRSRNSRCIGGWITVS